MDTRSLIVNPKIRILHHKGRFFAVELARKEQHVPVTQPYMVLLSSFLRPRRPAEAARELASGALRHLPRLGPLEIERVIAQLAGAGVLVAAMSPDDPAMPPDDSAMPSDDTAMPPDDSATPPDDTATPPDDEGATQRRKLVLEGGGDGSLQDHALRLGLNFALHPTADGFATWSAVEQVDLVLDLAMVGLLFAFAEGARPSQVLPGESVPGRQRIATAIGTLKAKGLLVPTLRPDGQPPDKPQGPAVLPLGPNAMRWQDLPVEDKIPVYFVPHTENHLPLALGMMHSAITAHDGGALLERYQLIPITFLSGQAMFDGPYRKFGPGVWLFSNYMWCLDYNLRVAKLIKSHHSGNLCIHGGPSTPGYKEACTSFMHRNLQVDIAVHGEGEVTVAEVLESAGRRGVGVGFDTESLREVAGLTFRDPATGELVWTAPRTRMTELDVIPSPYLTGAFDAYQGRVEAAILETNRGCPFGCTFCDWGSATKQKVRKFDLERVRQEIEWMGRNEIRSVWIADANFGMYDRDIEISEMIVDAKSRLGYPREVVVNYAKNTNVRLIEIIRVLSQGGILSHGIISIQTSDDATLKVINRQNIKTEKYDELARVFEEANLPLATDLMIGLPGITPKAWDRDLQRYFDFDVPAKAYRTRLLPNSPMADPEYMRKYRIEVDEDDYVIACHSFTRDELTEMRIFYEIYTVADVFGLFRYVLRYLQWDHGILAMDFLRKLLDMSREHPARYPVLTWVMQVFYGLKTVPGGWRGLYRELEKFIADEYAIMQDAGLAVALQVNETAMPDDTLSYPRTQKLDHDFVAYFKDRKISPGKGRKLVEYPPGSFTVSDPDFTAHGEMHYMEYDAQKYFWELRSAISRARSITEFGGLDRTA